MNRRTGGAVEVVGSTVGDSHGKTQVVLLDM